MNTSRYTDTDLNAYVDGELDAEAVAKMEEWLATHPEHARRVAAYRQQNEELHNLFDDIAAEPVPPRMSDLVRKPRAASTKPVWARIAAAIVLLLTGAAGGWGLHGLQGGTQMSAPPGFVERAVGAHIVYASEVLHPVEVAADQETHLVKWLSKRLGSPLRAPRLTSNGYNLVGGRLLEDSGTPAAQFMYENHTGQRVTVYVRSYTGKDTAFKFFDTDTTSAFYWMDAPFAYALAGDIPRQNLLDIAHVVYKDLTP